MRTEEQERRVKDRYRALKALRPDLYERAVYVGSLVMIDGNNPKLAAQVEESVVALVLEALESHP